MKKRLARPVMKTARLARAQLIATQIAALQKQTYALLARVDYLVAAWTLKP